MKREEYLDQMHKIRAKVNRSEEFIYTWDYNGAYKKLITAGLECYRLASKLRKDERYKR